MKQGAKGDGTYATSMPWHHAMDPGADVLLAFKQVRALAGPFQIPSPPLPGWLALCA